MAEHHDKAKEAYEKAFGEKVETPRKVAIEAPEGVEQHPDPRKDWASIANLDKIEDENTDSDEPETEPETEEKAEAPKPEPKESKARKNLVLRGWNKKAAEALDDDEAEAQWSALQERERYTDDLKQQLAELRKRSEAAEPAGEPSPEPAPAADLGKELSAFLEEIGVDASSEAGKALTGTFEKLTGTLSKQVETLQQQLQEQQERAVHEGMRAQRGRLAKLYPRLAESDVAWNAVRDAAVALHQKGTDGGPDELFTAAAEALYGEPIQEVETDAPVKDAAAPSRPSQKGKREKKLTGMQKAYQVFRDIERGGDGKRIAKQLG